MEYPALDPNAKLFKIYEKALSPYYDIVWSFDYYATSIPANSQLGICLFLQDSQGLALGQNYSILASPNGTSYLAYPNESYFLAYIPDLTLGRASYILASPDGTSYLAYPNESYYLGYLLDSNTIDFGYSGPINGVDKGMIGVGLDSTGSFALAISSVESLVRDGEIDSRRKLNSLSVRGQAPAYSWNEYSINLPLSTFNFNVLETRKKTIRARLGNVGQTLYVDFRYSPLEDFVNILTQDVTFSKTLSSRFRPGVTFVKPVSGIAPSPVIRFSNFTVEGREGFTYVSPPSSVVPLVPPTVDDTCLVTDCEYLPPAPTVPELYTPPPTVTLEPAAANRQHIGQIIINLNNAFNRGIDNGYSSYDLYNFGYNLTLYNTTTTEQTVLTRSDYFVYLSADSTITLSLSSFNSTWKLVGPGINYTNNSSDRPVGTYSNFTISYT